VSHKVLRTARTHPRGVAEEERGHIVETQRLQQEWGGAKTLLKKAPHNGQRVPPRNGGQPPLSGQVVVKSLREHVERTVLTYCYREPPSVTQPGEESLEGDTVVTRCPALLPAIVEKRANAGFVEGFGTKLMLLEPVTQMGDQSQFLLGCGVGVPLLG
jgi:hypothetical protein